MSLLDTLDHWTRDLIFDMVYRSNYEAVLEEVRDYGRHLMWCPDHPFEYLRRYGDCFKYHFDKRYEAWIWYIWYSESTHRSGYHHILHNCLIRRRAFGRCDNRAMYNYNRFIDLLRVRQELYPDTYIRGFLKHH